jgi:hypothetical protein
MKINGSRVVGLGPCGGAYVSGFAQNSAWVIQPPPVEPTKLEVDVICQNCFGVIYPKLAGPPIATKRPAERYVYLVVGLILGPPVILAILAIALIATPFWSILWVVLDNGPMDKSPKDWWDLIWDLIARRMIPSWWKIIRGGNSQADERPEVPQAFPTIPVADRLGIGSQAQTTDHLR